MSEHNGYSGNVWIDLDELDPRPASEMRVRRDPDAVQEYSEVIAKLPPMLVARDRQGKHWTIDGAHRYEGAKLAGYDRVRCRVRNVENYLEAFAAACHANDENLAVRVTNADKRHRVEIALTLPEMAEWSSRLIAKACGVHQTTVLDVRKQFEVMDSITSPAVKGKDGKKYPSKKPKPKTKPEPSPEPTREPTPPEEPWEEPTAEEPEESAAPAAAREPEIVEETPEEELEDEPEEFDMGMAWRPVEAFLEDSLKGWPEHLHMVFASRLQAHADLILKGCPNVKDRSHEAFA